METRTIISLTNEEIGRYMDLECWEGFVCCYRPNADDGIIGLGALESLEMRDVSIEEQFARIEQSGKLWMGFLSYDLKNAFEKLTTQRPHPMDFPQAHFFVPMVVFKKEKGQWILMEDHAPFDWVEQGIELTEASYIPEWRACITKEDYLKDVQLLLEHIHRGDIYEINYCQPYIAALGKVPKWNVFERLNAATEAPYSAYLHIGKHRFLCASPELFLKKSGQRLISSPIKGTVRRGTNEAEDQALKSELYNDIKERGENVMIVDLVRNDLSRVAKKNSVEVEELFGIHSFKTVHHMISTVACDVKEDKRLYDVLKATFPMGSMTGAPKVSAMKWADEVEWCGRGAYSGSIGCIYPNGDYEFNVVIRTIMVDESQHKAMFHVGGAITALCEPEKEYEETLLKGKALMQLNW